LKHVFPAVKKHVNKKSSSINERHWPRIYVLKKSVEIYAIDVLNKYLEDTQINFYLLFKLENCPTFEDGNLSFQIFATMAIDKIGFLKETLIMVVRKLN
jgi:hypothetical protein